MAKIWLLGTSEVGEIPSNIVEWLRQYTSQGHQFIVGDHKGAERAFHRALSFVGATDNSFLYSMGYSNYNNFDLKRHQFNTYFDEQEHKATIALVNENNEIDPSFEPIEIIGIEKEADISGNSTWYSFLGKQMVKDCDIAIVIWDGTSKTILNYLQLMNIYGKTYYSFLLQ